MTLPQLRAAAGAVLLTLVVAHNVDAQKRTNRKTAPRTTRAVSAARPPVARQPAWTAPAGGEAWSAAVGAALASHTKSGEWGAMIVSLTRGDTLFAQNPDGMMQP